MIQSYLQTYLEEIVNVLPEQFGASLKSRKWGVVSLGLYQHVYFFVYLFGCCVNLAVMWWRSISLSEIIDNFYFRTNLFRLPERLDTSLLFYNCYPISTLQASKKWICRIESPEWPHTSSDMTLLNLNIEAVSRLIKTNFLLG